jgi:hypothetical protein
MKYLHAILFLTLVCLTTACSDEKIKVKGFRVSSTSDDTLTDRLAGSSRDSLTLRTQPERVLLTGVPNVRLTTVYKLNVSRRNNSTFIGSTDFYYRYLGETERKSGNNWNGNIMPGFEAAYGYNMVNVSHCDIKENRQRLFFENPVLIKTLYYPTFSRDTLNGKPVKRDYFLVSVYDEDTDKDGFIGLKDLRRLYLFDINGEKQMAPVPKNYSVLKSEYDSANDFMYVFAQLDDNDNGRRDDGEPVHIFRIDLKNPYKTGRQF